MISYRHFSTLKRERPISEIPGHSWVIQSKGRGMGQMIDFIGCGDDYYLVRDLRVAIMPL